MEKAELQWPTFLGVIIVVCVFLALTLTITGQWHWLRDAAAASWVQAIVATIAIVAGAAGLYWQAGQQHRFEAARLTAEEARRLTILFGAVFDLRTRLKRSTWHELGPFETDWQLADQAVDLLRGVPLLDVPDWRVAFAMRQAIDTYALLRRTVPYNGRNDPPKEWCESAYGLIKTAIAHAKQAQDHIEAAIRQRKALVPTITTAYMTSSDE
jgi:hypothetical protein